LPAIAWILAAIIAVVSGDGACAPGGEAPVDAKVSGHLPAVPATALSLDDIVVLARRVGNPDLVIARIQAAGAHFRLSAADVISLRDRGLPLVVIEHILAVDRQVSGEAGGNIPPQKPQAAPPSVKARTWPLIPALYQGL
jgi:hypothetical protein